MRRRSSVVGFAALCAAAAWLTVAASAAARTLVVTDRGDHQPGRCTKSDCTVREAVIAANKRSGADTIVLPQCRRYELFIESTGEDKAADGDLDVTSGPLKIVHRGRGTATIDANRTDRVFDIGAARTRLERLTIRGGKANPLDAGGDGGGITAGDIGDAPLTIARSRVVDNSAPAVDGNGGGIDTDIAGLLRVVRSTVSGNDAGGDGGGITASLDGPTLIERSTIAGNEAGEGAGVMAVGPVTVIESTISRNRAVGGADGEVGDGAGIYIDDQGILDLANSTIAENLAIASGAGLFAETGAIGTINSATFARNIADSDGTGGGGGGGTHLSPGTSIAISNSILALNTLAGAVTIEECGGAPFANEAPNLVTTTGGGACDPGAEVVAPDPLIGELARNGGPTQTIALLPGSPAIGAADPASAPPADQRRIARDDPDLGAYELR